MVIVHCWAEICSLLSDFQFNHLIIQGQLVSQVKHENCPIKKQIASDFSQLISRIGNSKLHTVRTKFYKNYTQTHQKARRVPINLLDKVFSGLRKLSDQGHIEKLSKYSDQIFISPMVFTVKKNKSVKLAHDSKVLNKTISENRL